MTKFKKIFLINILVIIMINLLTNINFFISCFNSQSQVYNEQKIIYNNNDYYIKNINNKINLIEINFKTIPNDISIDYTSENFNNFEHFNGGYYKTNITKNKIYIKTAINEKVKDLKIQTSDGEIFSVIINPKISYKLNVLLTIGIYLSIVVIYNLLTKNTKLDISNKKQKLILVSMLFFVIALCFNYYITNKSDFFNGNIYDYYYVNSVIDGKLSLDYPVDENLLNSSNPYDTSDRSYNYFWDASYYNGKYYCYFGILPLIMLFVPFKLITNSYLPTIVGCLIYSILGIIGTFLIYNKIIEKYFKNISIQTYIISFLFVIFGSKLLWCMHRPSFYELVSLAAYAHVMFGLYFVLFKDKRILNILGYFLLASAVLCRPTFLLASTLILPKIILKIKERKFKLCDYIYLIIPYALIGVITMYINYIRFDSVFEFGVSYQLTTNNMSNFNFNITKALYSVINYLFGGIEIKLFPFTISETYHNLNFLGDFFVENIGGGILTTSIIGYIIFFTPKIFKDIKEKEIKIYVVLSIILGVFLMFISSSIGSLIGRYMLDFNYLFYFLFIILSLYLLKKYKNNLIINIYKFIILLSIIINYLLIYNNIY